MDGPSKIKMPYDNFKVRPGGYKKMREERKSVVMRVLYNHINTLIKKNHLAVHVAKNNYRNSQKCTVKVSYASNKHKGQWMAHGRYLGRKGAQREDEKGLGFNETEEDLSITKKLDEWQKSKDPRIWKLIISPEMAANIDLKEHIRGLMKKVENDLGTKLQWVAIDHYNTLHFHVHLVIRGIRDDGQELIIKKDYIATGFRDRSQQILTQKLGLRIGPDLLEINKKVVNERHVTAIDRQIGHKLTKDHIMNLDWCTQNGYLYQKNLQFKKRLEFLESLGLAKKFTDASWYVDSGFLDRLKFIQEQDDVSKLLLRHSDQVIDKDLSTIVNKLPKLGDTIIGRVVGTGLSERDEDQRYIFIEGIDGKIHYVKANTKIIWLRDSHQLSAGDIIHLERSKFVKDNKEISYIKVDTFNDFGSLRLEMGVTSVDRYIINEIIKNGYIPKISQTANAVRVEFMKIVQGRVNHLKRLNIINDRLELNKERLERSASLKRRLG